MADTISTYAELQAAVGDWLNRDETQLAASPKQLIMLFEARMNRVLRVPEMEELATSTTTEETLALPSDFLELRELRVDDEVIPGWSPQALREYYQDSTETEVKGYALVGNEILLQPAPGASVTVALTYYEKIPALSDSNTTNWLLEKHPDLYLAGSIARANLFLHDSDGAAQWAAYETAILDELMAAGIKQRLPAGPLASRPAVYE